LGDGENATAQLIMAIRLAFARPRPQPTSKEPFSMYRKYLVATALVAAFATPSFAATTYYVSQDKTTLKCYVVKKIGKNGQQIGKTSYKSKADATAAKAAATECTKM